MPPHQNPNSKPSGKGVTAVLGPTNTGKTHYAIERMTAYPSGVIGLPLRLLAREVYHRVAEKVGVANVALVTGEEKINPPNARFQVCTVEAMPSKTDADFVAIDEVQLATSLDRGHTFTDRLLNLRGVHETLLLGASTVENTLRQLLPGLHVITRPRMSTLTYSGSKKITRLPRRSAIVAFSADEVYAIAELIRRQRGGAAVVLGSLSPRTRNAQVALYQQGEVDFLVATDAIGMGLNLDLDHVALAQDQKFDGHQYRKLTAAELAQVTGRAGRHTRDGTFGVTGQVSDFPDELVEALETHQFAPLKVLTWRNRDISFSSLEALRQSLARPAPNKLLMRSPPTSDSLALENLGRDHDVVGLCTNEEKVSLLWDVCKTPDYRRISPMAHAELLGNVFLDIAQHGSISESWFAGQVEQADRTDGDIDVLSARISQIRTWTYLSHRPSWLQNAKEWQEKTRLVEDKLSDALHEALTKRFIDRRTSVLMKRLRENAMLEAVISEKGEVSVEGHHVGELRGFRFSADPSATGPDAKAATAAAMKALAGEIEKRADRLSACSNNDLALGEDASLRWLGEPIAKLSAGEDVFKPKVILLADEQLTGAPRDKVGMRLERWVANHINTLLKPLVDLATDPTLEGMAKGVAFRIAENLGILSRRDIADDIKALDQDARATLRKHGVRFGAHHIFVPLMLKPAPTSLICFLWALKNDRLDAKGLSEVSQASAAGRTSMAVEADFDRDFYQLCGFRVLGQKAVRIDILERLADLIRPTTSWKPEGESPKPEGAIDGRSFFVTPAMMSILGATHEDMEVILKGLGYRFDTKLESEVKPTEEKPAGEEKTNEASNDEPKPEEPAAPTDDTAKQNVELAASSSDVKAETKEDEGPKTIQVWRYGGNSSGARKHAPDNRGPRKPGAGKPNQNKNRHAGKGKRPQDDRGARNNNQKRPEKQPDPDSPFAKLAALKAAMKK